MRLALVALLAGCSLVAVRQPPRSPSAGPLECTDTYVPPIIDVAMTGLGVGLALMDGGCTSETHDGFCLDRWLAKGMGVVIGVVSGISALHGFNGVHRCRVAQAQRAHDDCLRERAEAQRNAMEETDLERRTAALRVLPSC